MANWFLGRALAEEAEAENAPWSFLGEGVTFWVTVAVLLVAGVEDQGAGGDDRLPHPFLRHAVRVPRRADEHPLSAAGDAGAKPAIEAPTSGTRERSAPSAASRCSRLRPKGTGSATPPITAGSSTSRSTCT